MNQHRPRKRFGQNFLHDQGVIQRIVHAIAAEDDDHIVEIGPGRGALTLPILPLCRRLDIIELDRDLVAWWQNQTLQGNLQIHAADALKFDFTNLLEGADDRLKLIGNLPYNISSPLIFHLLEFHHYIDDMTFMLQKEVAHRMAAEPGSKAYGRLSVMVQYHCDVEIMFDVGPESFDPPPKVDSSIIRLQPRLPSLSAIDVEHLSALVSQAFSQRRKTLRNTLKPMATESQIEQAGIDPAMRAETVSLEAYIRLSNLCRSL